MPKYVIERTVPGVGSMSAAELQALAAKSNAVIEDVGPGVQWVHSYVTPDKLFCVYNATDAEIILEHARCGGFPVDEVTPVATVIDPVTGES